MKMTRLGKNGPKCSQFGIGAMSFAGLYGDATEADSHAVLDACLAAGVTHIDTANVYGMGRSEEIIGTWLSQHPGVRDQVTIATTEAALSVQLMVAVRDQAVEAYTQIMNMQF